ncbi:MAG: DNA methyltransferase [Nocardioidaceae bacterium]
MTRAWHERASQAPGDTELGPTALYRFLARRYPAWQARWPGARPRWLRRRRRHFDAFDRRHLGSASTTSLATGPRVSSLGRTPGNLVLDPTCGSGTTAYAAEQWGRRWITVDTSRVALALARQRVMGAKFPYYLLADSTEGRAKEQTLTAKPLPQAAVTDDIRHGFVYERVQHITLKSIANNPDITEGMSREEIDAAIKRHADFEMLYDKPYEDKRKVRVAGPFTVESLSPHRSLAFAGSVEDENRETIAEQDAGTDAEGPSFEQSILDNLAKAGIQNGRRNERISFATMETYAGSYIQAVGERAYAVQPGQPGDGEEPAPTRVAIAIGPQYGTVSPSYVKSAAREAIRAEDVDLLCILGFAFDPQVTGVTEQDGVTVEASDDADGCGQRRGRAQARQDPGPDGADERRPADGRGAEEDRRREPVHGVRRARHRARGDRRRPGRRTAERRRRLRPHHRRGPQQRHRAGSPCG